MKTQLDKIISLVTLSLVTFITIEVLKIPTSGVWIMNGTLLIYWVLAIREELIK